MAGPILTGKVVFVDQATRVLQRIRQAHQQLTQTVQAHGGVMNAGIHITQRANQAANTYANSMQNVAAKTKTAERHTRDMHITLTGMLRVMAMFAINLQIIRALTSPYTFLREGIAQVASFQDGLAQVNALLRLSDSEIKKFGRSVQEVASLYGIEQKDMLNATKELASSISSLNLGNLSQQEAIMKMLRASAKGAVIDNATLTDSSAALRAVMAALNIEVEHSERVFSMLFATVDVGNIRFNEMQNAIGKWAGILGALAPRDIEGRLKFLQETLSMFGALTNVMPVSEAETATGRILTSLSKEASEVGKLRRELEQLTGIPLGLDVYTKEGPMAWLNNLSQAIGRDSALVKSIMAGQRDIATMSAEEIEAASSSISTRLLSAFFPNIRASTPVMIFLQDMGKQLQMINEDLKDTQKNLRESFNNAYATAVRNKQRFEALYGAIRTSLLGPITDEAASIMQDIANAVHSVVFSDDFEELSVAERIRKVLTAVSDTLNSWWNSGGRLATLGFAHNFTLGLLTFLQTAVIDNMSKFIDVGASIAMGIVSGMLQFILNPRNFTNPLVQAIALKSLGVGWGKSIAIPFGAQYVNDQIGGVFGGGTGGDTTGVPGAIDGGSSGGGGFWSNAGNLAATIGNIALIGGAWALGQWGLKSAGRFALGKATGMFGAGARSVLQTTGIAVGAKGLERGLSSNPATWMTRNAAGRFTNLQQALFGFGAGRTWGAQFGGGLRGILGGAKSIATSPMVSRVALPLLAFSMFANGVGPGRDQGGISGLLSSALFGHAGPEAGKQDKMDWSTIGSTTLGGAATGAAVGSIFGPLGAAIGGIGGGALGFLGSFRQQRANARFNGTSTDPFASLGSGGPAMASNGLITAGPRGSTPADFSNVSYKDEKAFLERMGVANAPPGIVAEIIRQAEKHGITNPRQLARFVAFNLGVIEAESGFRQDIIANDPTAADPTAKSIGLYQLNTAPTGQGYGHSMFKMKEAIYNTQVGAGNIAAVWDPNKSFFEMAQASGHPGFSNQAQHIASARRVETLSNAYLSKINNQHTFSEIANGGVTPGDVGGGGGGSAVVVQVNGNMVIQADNPEELAAAIAEGLYNSRARG